MYFSLKFKFGRCIALVLALGAAVLLAALLPSGPGALVLESGGSATDEILENPVEPAAAVSGTVYLTYDDGPSPVTGELLDQLSELGVKATFFVTAQRPQDFPRITRAASEGHLVAPHAYSHEYSSLYASEESFWDEMDRCAELILELTGKAPAHLRFPGGSSNTISRRYGVSMERLAAQCAERGITYHDWNVDTADNLGNTLSADTIASRALRGCREKDPAIVLMHDSPNCTTAPEATRIIVEQLLAEGYAFDTLDHLSEPVHHSLG